MASQLTPPSAMDENGGGIKLTGIRQIVKLKEMLQKWQSVTLSSKSSNSRSNHGGISPVINKRLTNVTCDSDEDSCCYSPEPPHDVPRGYLAVYVGPELRRFIIPTSYLSHSLFKVLLEKAEEEFGFDHSGALTLPCEIETFKYLLKCIERGAHSDQDSSAEDQTCIEE
ncbi:Auxin-responsive protein-like protein [Melia azedarach]|uniref:Auxin-responsive protein-like protein n=1 Tax=Melia azedarach TaxID=155640 RepID=A0ACC1XDU2_MELAZ|nr:Auxin-responsive protein-like protein [Melia azedarach]